MFMPDLSDSRTQFSNESHNQVNNTAEQIIMEFLLLRDFIHIDLDLDVITQTTILKIFERVDGTNYSEVKSVIFDPTYVVGDFDTDVMVVETELDGGGQDMKLTMQSTVAEGMDMTIPFSLETRTRP